MQTRAGRDTRGIGGTYDLEVIILVQVVAGYRFVEAQHQVVAYAQDSIGRLGYAEHTRRTGILHTADHGRRLGDEARTVAAEADSTQVIMLLHRVTLAVEAERRDTAVDDLGLVTRSQVVEAVVGVERTLVDPHILRLGRELVLELDVVEVLMTDIESTDVNRQVVARRIFGREGIHYPVLLGRCDIHVAADRQEVYAQVERGIVVLQAVVYVEEQPQAVIVVHQSALYLYDLLESLARLEPVRYGVDERRTTQIDLGAIRVGSGIQSYREERTARSRTGLYLTRITQLYAEHRTLIRRHARLLVYIHAQLRHGNRLRRVVKQHTRVVVLGLLLFLMHAVGRTRFGEEDVTAEELVLVGIDHVQVLANGGGSIFPYRIHVSAIDAHRDIALCVRREGKAATLAHGAVVRGTHIGIEAEYRLQVEAPLAGGRERRDALVGVLIFVVVLPVIIFAVVLRVIISSFASACSIISSSACSIISSCACSIVQPGSTLNAVQHTVQGLLRHYGVGTAAGDQVGYIGQRSILCQVGGG